MGRSTKVLAVTFFVLLLVSAGMLVLLLSKLTSPSPKKALCPDCNVILISMTNLRYDHMSGNGYFWQTTPNLDRLAGESLVFDSAFAHASWTLPDAISIYTSLYPMEHGIMNRYDGSTLAKETPTLIDILNQEGYKTAALTGGFDYAQEFGLTSRFDFYDECAKGQLPTYPRQTGPRVGPSQYGKFACTIPKALDWLKKNTKNKFFLHVQGFDAHCPFSQRGDRTYDKDYKGNIDYSSCLWTFDRVEPIIQDGKKYYPVFSSKTGTEKKILLGEEDIKHLIAIYDEGITEADKLIGLFIKEVKNLGLDDKTIIIFTSEHGDMFGKYGRFMRGGPLRGTFYDDVLHTPLIIKIPKIPQRKIDELVQHIDLMPTIINLLDLASKSHMEGKSLLPLILDNKSLHQYIFAGSQFTPSQDNIYFSKKTQVETIRSKEWKLIRERLLDSPPSQTLELYDIVNDKVELNNLAQKRQDIVDNLEKKLDSWVTKLK